MLFRSVVLLTGSSNAPYYRTAAAQIAKFGYEVIVYPSYPFWGNPPASASVPPLEPAIKFLETAIRQAQQMPHALPGKVGLVGFSLGGSLVLYYGSTLADLAAVGVAWYPSTVRVKDPGQLVQRFQIPLLVLVGESDQFQDRLSQLGPCCLASTARAIEAAAAAAGRQLALVVYPGTGHDFIEGGLHYNGQAYSDGMQRTQAELAKYLH